VTSNGPPKRVTAPWTPPGNPARRSPGRRVGSPENAAPKGGRSHPRLNIAGRPIAQKYCEGKVKRISKGRSKALEIAEGEAYAAVACPRTVLRGRGSRSSRPRSRSSRSGARRRGFGGARKPGGYAHGGSAGGNPRSPSGGSPRGVASGPRASGPGPPAPGGRGGAFRAGLAEASSAFGRGRGGGFREGRFGLLRVSGAPARRPRTTRLETRTEESDVRASVRERKPDGRAAKAKRGGRISSSSGGSAPPAGLPSGEDRVGARTTGPERRRTTPGRGEAKGNFGGGSQRY